MVENDRKNVTAKLLDLEMKSLYEL